MKELCGITSTIHIQIDGLVEGDQLCGHQMTTLDYFLWGSMKSLVYATPVTSEEDQIARVHGAIEILSRQPHLLDYVRAAQRRRCRLCIDVGGTQFEPRL